MAGQPINPHGTTVTLPNGQVGTIPPPTASGQGAVIVYENWTGMKVI